MESLGREAEALAYYEQLLRHMPQSSEIRQKVLALRARGAGNRR
jgi:hypothetical protein